MTKQIKKKPPTSELRANRIPRKARIWHGESRTQEPIVPWPNLLQTELKGSRKTWAKEAIPQSWFNCKQMECPKKRSIWILDQEPRFPSPRIRGNKLQKIRNNSSRLQVNQWFHDKLAPDTMNQDPTNQCQSCPEPDQKFQEMRGLEASRGEVTPGNERLPIHRPRTIDTGTAR
jgi:hypothetical protein